MKPFKFLATVRDGRLQATVEVDGEKFGIEYPANDREEIETAFRLAWFKIDEGVRLNWQGKWNDTL